MSRWVVDALLDRPRTDGAPLVGAAVTSDRDLQLALWMLYELSYRGFDGVAADREWDVELIRVRLEIEAAFERELRLSTRASTSAVLHHEPVGSEVGEQILRLVEDDDGPHLSSYLRREATLDQMRDFLRERSIQQLKESDPQAFLLARLEGPAKVALAEIQYDEYGAGRADRLHQSMYAQTLERSGLTPTYGAYIDDVSAISLASANVMSLFALNRRLLGAGVGHFTAFEASSSVPSRRIAAGMARLGLPDSAAAYFLEHVEADSVHEQVAARDLCGALVADHPELRADLVFGAACALHLDALSGAELLGRWQTDREADRGADEEMAS